MNPKMALSMLQRSRTFSTVEFRRMKNRLLSTDVKQQAISMAESASKSAESAAKNAAASVKQQTASMAESASKSTESAAKNASASVNAGVASAKNAGSTFIQRITAFLAGTAVGFGANFYLVHEELVESNKRFEKTLQEIQRKIA